MRCAIITIVLLQAFREWAAFQFPRTVLRLRSEIGAQGNYDSYAVTAHPSRSFDAVYGQA